MNNNKEIKKYYHIKHTDLEEQLELFEYDYNVLKILANIKSIYSNCAVQFNKIILINKNFYRQTLSILDLIQIFEFNEITKTIYIVYDKYEFDTLLEFFPNIKYTIKEINCLNE